MTIAVCAFDVRQAVVYALSRAQVAGVNVINNPGCGFDELSENFSVQTRFGALAFPRQRRRLLAASRRKGRSSTAVRNVACFLCSRQGPIKSRRTSQETRSSALQEPAPRGEQQIPRRRSRKALGLARNDTGGWVHVLEVAVTTGFTDRRYEAGAEGFGVTA